ncbi:MAG TPA: branched-chain amino acid ABC transporter permease [Methylomirabilota bacterium]|nr:branched-chain amino acid ABC transporter permease [Methylomirabilota bacterium]
MRIETPTTAPRRAAVLVIVLLGLLLSVPGLVGAYWVIVISSALALSIACLGVNLLLGYTGLLSLGHAAYFGTGAYAGAFLYAFGDAESLETYLAAGVGAATALAAVSGLVCVHATRLHFSILTVALAQVLHSLFVGGAVFLPFGDRGKGFYLVGHGGFHIPRFTIAGIDPGPEAFVTVLYYIILTAFLISLGLMWRLVRSPFGTALRAIRDNATRAACVGIPVRSYRWRAFVISAMFTGLAGGLTGQLDRQITPQQLDWFFSIQLVVATVLGGPGRFFGPVGGAFLVVALKEVALRFALYHNAILGVLLVAIVIARRRERAATPDRFIPEVGRSAPWA